MKKWVQHQHAWSMGLAGALMLSLVGCGGGGNDPASAAPASQGGNPQPVVQPDVVNVQDVPVAAGVGYSLGVNASGAVQVWGTGMAGSAPAVANVKAVGATRWGGNWAVLATGDALYWGNDASGALSHASAVSLSGLGRVAALRACGQGADARLVALKTDGTVRVVSPAGLSASTQGLTVAGLSAVKALVDGGDASCNNVLAVGANGLVSQLQVGGTEASAVLVAGLSRVAQASCASDNCLVVTDEGQVWGWGSNAKGQMGDETVDARVAPAQVDLSLLATAGVTPKVRQVLLTQAGAAYALSENGALYGWGRLDGRVKATVPGAPGTAPTPILNANFKVQQVVSASAESGQTLILSGDGKVFGWGRNAQSEVTSANTATLLSDLTDTGVKLR
ncbi:hypothetical protein [Aquabacterium sp.]|uniref:hypothetical protein n=1 Tax=Aquabacterium sp. TaxID=1872578 RepID=UPI002E2EBCCB|nr:hypothetical protein [Aquabacterium sp.]HEX5310766.1 hypothetical protein [Aquabacterium sp.]